MRLLTPAFLALSVGLSSFSPLAFANPGDVNGTTDAQNVPGGTYYNTAGNHSTFTNSAGTGLYISPSTVVTGREVSDSSNPTGSMTGNGGNLLFDAPGQVVRIDGRIDVNALQNGSGAYLGNGGTVTVNAAYLDQNGQIYAMGKNGGHVQFNVGSLTMGPAAAIFANGVTGNGGVVNLGGGSGAIDIQRGAIVDTSGKVIGEYDTNLITIQGGLINMNGILMANGIQDGEGNATSGGGILLIANGHTTGLDSDMLNQTSFMSDVKDSLLARDADLRSSLDGWISIGSHGQILANGANGLAGKDGGYGGLVYLLAKCGINNQGLIQANGGNGGDASATQGKVILVEDAPAQQGSFQDESPKLSDLKQGDTQNVVLNNTTSNGDTLSSIQAQTTYNPDGTVTVRFYDPVTQQYLTPQQTSGQATSDSNGITFTKDEGFSGTLTFTSTYNGATIQYTRTVEINTDFHACDCHDVKTADVSFTLKDGTYEIAAKTHTEQNSVGQAGGAGGDGGGIIFEYGKTMTNDGVVEAKGGNGGKGGNATSNAADVTTAQGGNGGDGGYGGLIGFIGPVIPTNYSDLGNAHLNVNGGNGGQGGTATAQEAQNGLPGNPGEAGLIGFAQPEEPMCTSGCDAPGNPPGDPEDPTDPTPPTTITPNLLGLFQDKRPVFNEPVNRQVPPLMIALGQSKMFLAKTYTSVTQEILNLALREYNRLLAIGRQSGQASEEAKELLQRSGVDNEVATALLEKIKDGRLQASDVVVKMLKEISEKPTEQPQKISALAPRK